jgi:DNA-binding NtrC family response regulator
LTARRVLIVDGDVGCRTSMAGTLRTSGFDVALAATASSAEIEFRLQTPDLAIVDSHLQDDAGLRLLALFKSIDVRVPVVVLTDHATIELAVAAVKSGAENFLVKPLEPTALLVVVQRALENYRNRRRQVALAARDVRRERDPFAGVSPQIRLLADEAHRVLDSDRPILIQGETGTGKGVVAAWLHHHGPRAEESFVDINCASLSSELMESELFGHERGAFTGAASAKLGLLEVADRGTMFLDEIGEIGLPLQPRLLKVVEDGRFRRVGDVRDRLVDVRLITATNRDLRHLSDRGAFRSDLYFRINTLHLTMPPLRQRPEDIPILARNVAADICAGRPLDFTAEAIHAMQRYPWPGNVRELRNVIERAALLSNGAPRLGVEDLRFDIRLAEGSVVVRDVTPDHTLTLEAMERRHVERMMRLESGAVDRAASRLGISRSTLYGKLKRYRDRDVAEGQLGSGSEDPDDPDAAPSTR